MLATWLLELYLRRLIYLPEKGSAEDPHGASEALALAGDRSGVAKV